MIMAGNIPLPLYENAESKFREFLKTPDGVNKIYFFRKLIPFKT